MRFHLWGWYVCACVCVCVWLCACVCVMMALSLHGLILVQYLVCATSLGGACCVLSSALSRTMASYA